MHPLKKLYCRTFQTVFKLAIPFLPYRSPELLHGMDELIDKLKALKLNHVLLVTDKGIRSLGLTSHLEQLMEQNNIFCTVYDGTVANPTTDNVEEALHLYKLPVGGYYMVYYYHLLRKSCDSGCCVCFRQLCT